jgi:chemotaxis protein methyltransferase CheR
MREFEFGDRDFRRICELIHARAGIALADGKRDMVYGRLSRRVRALGLQTFREYLDQLEREGGDEWQAFTNALTTNLTAFFREQHHFDRLRTELQQRRDHGPLKIWSCAASTGEEPYSLAITACEAYGTLHPPIRILATDVDTQVLATGERGVYPVERVAGLSQEMKRRYFQRGAGSQEGLAQAERMGGERGAAEARLAGGQDNEAGPTEVEPDDLSGGQRGGPPVFAP